MRREVAPEDVRLFILFGCVEGLMCRFSSRGVDLFGRMAVFKALGGLYCSCCGK